jgi:hypothetical protein
MPKVHFTPKYTYPNDGSIRAISICGLHSGIADKNFIDCTIVETRVNCKNCLRVMNAAKKLQQPPVSNSVCLHLLIYCDEDNFQRCQKCDEIVD